MKCFTIRQSVPRVLCLLGLAAVFGLTGPAAAQLGFAGGFAEAFEPDYVRRDVRTIAEELGLEEDQRMIVESLFEDYRAAFDDGLERMRQGMQDMKATLAGGNDPKEIMTQIFEPVNQWRNEKIQLKQELMENLMAFLTPEQMEQFPAFERKFTRSKALSSNKCKLAGEGIDLFSISREMDLENAGFIELAKPTLDEYDIAMHEALTNRDEVIRASHSDMVRMMQTDDGELGVAILSRQIAERISVRDVNELYTQTLADTLPEDLGVQFKQAMMEEAFPRVFRPTAVTRMFNAARELPDLDAKTVAIIDEIVAEYDNELLIFNDKLVATIKREEPMMIIKRAEQQAARMSGGERRPKLDDPIREEFRRRDAMADTYVRRLQDLLTPEQFASLPGATRYLQRNEKAAPGSMIEDNNGSRRHPTRGGKGGKTGRNSVKGGAQRYGVDADSPNPRMSPTADASRNMRDVRSGNDPDARPEGANGNTPDREDPRATGSEGKGGANDSDDR